MQPTKIVQMISLIKECVNDPIHAWTDKRRAVLNEADEDARKAMEEFASWFQDRK